MRQHVEYVHGWEIIFQGNSYSCPSLSRFGVYGYSRDLACRRAILRLIKAGKIKPLERD